MRRGFGRGVVRVEELDGFVACACEQFLILSPGEAFDDALMRLRAEDLFSARQVPNFDDSVAAAACESFERLWVLGHCIYSVDMAFSQLGNEGRSKHPIQLGGIQSSCVLPCSFEGMESWIQIPRLAGDTRAWGLMSRRWASQSLDFLLMILEIQSFEGRHYSLPSPPELYERTTRKEILEISKCEFGR